MIIVSDIFGRTPALERFACDIAKKADDQAVIVAPYESLSPEFKDEREAYRYFTSNVGLDAYTDRLLCKIKSCKGKVRLIGFSAGASAIWRISAGEEANKISSAVLFYSSQIRHYPDIEPQFPVRLIFPQAEEHFDVNELMEVLVKKRNVKAEQTPFFHGFMNPLSKNFNQTAYYQYLDEGMTV